MGHDETRARQTGTNKAQLKCEQRQAERVEQARAEAARTARAFAIAGARLLDALQATDAELEAAQDALAEVEHEGRLDTEAARWSAAVAEQVLEARDFARLEAEEGAADEAKGDGN
jgi:hypothetical protein